MPEVEKRLPWSLPFPSSCTHSSGTLAGVATISTDLFAVVVPLITAKVVASRVACVDAVVGGLGAALTLYSITKVYVRRLLLLTRQKCAKVQGGRELCVYHKPPQSQVARDGVGEAYHGAVRTCIPLLGSGVAGTVTGAGRDGSSTVLMCGSVSLFVSKLLHA